MDQIFSNVFVIIIAVVWVIALTQLLIKLLPVDDSIQRLVIILKRIERNSAADCRVAESIREEFSKEASLYHYWQEYFETVASRRHLGEIVLSATQPAENFFKFENIVHSTKGGLPINFEVFSATPGVLTGIGLLGTFYGLYNGLPAGGDLEQIIKDMGPFLALMKEAFAASFAGVLAALVFNLIEKFTRERIQSHCSELSFYIDRSFPLRTDYEVLSEIRNHADQQLAQFKNLAIDIGNQVVKGLVGGGVESVQIEQGIKDGISKGYGILAESLLQFVDVQKGFSESMTSMQATQTEIAANFKKIQESSSGTVEQIMAASSAIKASSDALLQLGEKIPELVGSLTKVVDGQVSASREIATLSERSLSTSDAIVQKTSELQKSLKGTVDAFVNANDDFSKKVREYHLEISRSLTGTLNGYDEALAGAVDKLNSGISNINILMTDFVEKFEVAVQKSKGSEQK